MSINNYYRDNYPKTYASTIGAMAGIAETAIGLPTANIGNAIISGSAVPKTPSALFRGWKIQSPTMMAFFASVVLLNEAIKKQIENTSTSFWKWASPAISGAVGTVFLNPTETIVAQMGKQKSLDTWKTAKHIYQEKGVQGFAKGAFWSMCRNAIYSLGVLLGTEHILKATGRDNSIERCAASGMAGGAVSIFSQPFHVLSIRSKLDASTDVTAIIKKEGTKAFYKGSSPRFVRMTAGSVLVANIVNYFMKNKE